MRLNVVTKHAVPADTREYAEQKLHRLERHASVQEASLTVDRDLALVPEASAEILVHIHHTVLTARCEAANVREAIDGAIDKADEQVRRLQERVTDRKGRVGADALPPRS
ncbi:MAG TPA: ribosome-associated translation inhibitor RaiA [Candidatus Binatia bacterium]|nr:ribosome-associated translation inhibitor RaiA [Candidatus Binatia bacterium]